MSINVTPRRIGNPKPSFCFGFCGRAPTEGWSGLILLGVRRRHGEAIDHDQTTARVVRSGTDANVRGCLALAFRSSQGEFATDPSEYVVRDLFPRAAVSFSAPFDIPDIRDLSELVASDDSRLCG
jgi:hypothetical protein